MVNKEQQSDLQIEQTTTTKNASSNQTPSTVNDELANGKRWPRHLIETSTGQKKLKEEDAINKFMLSWQSTNESLITTSGGNNLSKNTQSQINQLIREDQLNNHNHKREQIDNASSALTGTEQSNFSFGPIQELNAWQAAELEYFRHSRTVSVIITIAYTIVFIVGIVGNSFVVAIVCNSPRMRTVINYFIVNLAFADILVLLFCIPATLVSNLFIRKYYLVLAHFLKR